MSLLGGLTTIVSASTSRSPTRAAERLLPADVTASEAQSLTPREESALRRVRSVATLLDEAVRVPGTSYRVGLDPILGILPAGGDAVAAVLSLYPILEGYRLDVPTSTLVKMLWIVAIDAVVGSIPILGTLFDAVWKANVRNLETLESHIEAT